MKILIAVRDYDKDLYQDTYNIISSWGHEFYFYDSSINVFDYDAMLFLDHYKGILDDFYGIYQWCKKNGVLTIELDTMNSLYDYRVKLRDFFHVIKGDFILVNEKDEEIARSEEGKISPSEVENIVNWTVISCSIEDNKYKIIIGRK